MNATQIIQSCDFDGVRLTLTPEGRLHYSGDPAAITEWLPILRTNKSEIVEELHRERRHAQVLKMLEPGRKYGVLVEDDRADPVVVTCAIRGVATFELAIPKHSYDGLILLELLEKHSTEPRVEFSRPSGDTNPSPNGNGVRTAHPAGRKSS